MLVGATEVVSAAGEYAGGAPGGGAVEMTGASADGMLLAADAATAAGA